MWYVFGLGMLIGILIVVGVLKLTMREEPGGCIVIFGSFFLLIMLILIVVGIRLN